MTVFYFNNCHPQCTDKEELANAFTSTLLEYQALKTKYSDEVEGVVSHEITKLSFGDTCLPEIFELLKQKEHRNYAYRIFNKYPIESFFDIEKAFENPKEYKIGFDNDTQDAFFLKIAYDNKSVLFSLAISEEIKKNQLEIFSDDEPSLSIDNLFGIKDNTDYVENIILNEINSKKNNLELIKTIAKNAFTSSKFERTFNKVSSGVQIELIVGFQKIIELKEKGEPISEQILKHNNDDAELTLSYLKIRDPEAMRLYFSVIDGQYYLAALEKKPLKKGKTTEQSTHIKNARSMVIQMKKILKP